jgi:RNA polymerase sigma factor (sigma-70 family)
MAGTKGDYGTVNSAAYREQRALFAKYPRMGTVERTPELLRKWRGYRNSPIGLWEAVAAFQRGDVGAADGLVFAMYPAIKSIINKYGRKAWVNYYDCVQEGIAGLFEGAARFDLTTENMPFSYLYDYVRGEIQRFIIIAGEAIRIPVHIAEKRGKVGMQASVVFSEMTFDWDREPSQGFEELIVDNADPADEALDADLIERTIPLLGRWLMKFAPSPTNATMMLEYYGNDKTLKEIGDIYGLSRERVRQLNQDTIKKCRRVAEGHLGLKFEDYSTFGAWIADACNVFLSMRIDDLAETLTTEVDIARREVLKREAEQRRAERPVELEKVRNARMRKRLRKANLEKKIAAMRQKELAKEAKRELKLAKAWAPAGVTDEVALEMYKLRDTRYELRAQHRRRRQ